jgi:hypothetical protein
MEIFLTIVLPKIKAMGMRKVAGPDLGILCVGDGFVSLVLTVFSGGS